MSAALMTAKKPLYDLGDVPDLGYVPEKMLAQVIRQDRFGEPIDAFKEEAVPVPALGPHDVLVYVCAAGVNYNNVWAAMGVPIDVIKTRQKKGEKEAFHIGGSDASGIVWKVGPEVTNVKVGDEVVVHCGMWDPKDPWVTAGKDPMCLSKEFVAWGDAWMARKPPKIKGVGLGYMLKGDAGASNTDPFATAATPDNQWVQSGPHLMVATPNAAGLEGIPTDPQNGGPWVMWAGTPYAHVMVPAP